MLKLPINCNLLVYWLQWILLLRLRISVQSPFLKVSAILFFIPEHHGVDTDWTHLNIDDILFSCRPQSYCNNINIYYILQTVLSINHMKRNKQILLKKISWLCTNKEYKLCLLNVLFLYYIHGELYSRPTHGTTESHNLWPIEKWFSEILEEN